MRLPVLPYSYAKRWSATLLHLAIVLFLASCASQRRAVRHPSVRQPSVRHSPAKQRHAVRQPSSAEQPRAKNAKRKRLRVGAEDERVQQVIATARTYMGTPYRWGGTTRTGMDCSGLLVTTFRSCGLNLPRTSAEQSETGRLVSIYEVVPGDLVFFATKGRRVSHVGMVTEVRGKHNIQFIHASSSLGVIESNLFSDYYQKNFVKARRPF